MKVVFMGTPDFAVGTLEEIVKAGHEVAAVVTQPDKPKGRGKTLMPTPVKEAALKYEIPVYQPLKVRAEEFVKVLEGIAPDIIVVAAFGQIISKEILELPKYGCINVHASLLPAYRGAAPIQWAVINGDKESGVTIMQMDEGLDTGDMLEKVEVPLGDKITGGELHDLLAEAGAKLCVQTLEKLEKGELKPEKQGETPTAYARMLDKKLGNIDWTRPAAEIERLIRGLNPWPSAYTTWNEKTMKIWDADVVDTQKTAEPGTITEVTKQTFSVQTGDGVLQIKELQIPGKKKMASDAFLRGYQVKTGEKLGC